MLDIINSEVYIKAIIGRCREDGRGMVRRGMVSHVCISTQTFPSNSNDLRVCNHV